VQTFIPANSTWARAIQARPVIEDGEDGENGEDGEDGEDGEGGEDGEDEEDGEEGGGEKRDGNLASA
jgi:hypothetical protein